MRGAGDIFKPVNLNAANTNSEELYLKIYCEFLEISLIRP